MWSAYNDCPFRKPRWNDELRIIYLVDHSYWNGFAWQDEGHYFSLFSEAS